MDTPWWRARPLWWVLAGVAVGIQPAATETLETWAPLGLLAWVLLAFTAWRWPRLAGGALFLGGLLLGLLRTQADLSPALTPNHVAWLADGRRAVVRMRVRETPERVGARAEWPADILSIREEAGWLPLDGVALVQLTKAPTTRPVPFAAGECVEASVRLQPFRDEGLAPERPSWRRTLAEGVPVRAVLSPLAHAERVACQNGAPGAALERWRGEWAAWLDVSLPRAEAETLKSLSIGQGRAVPEAWMTSFVAAGTVHVLSISGLHVAVLTVLLFALIRRLAGRWSWWQRRYSTEALTAALVLPLVWGYVWLAGFGLPLWRSALMASVFLVGLLVGRRHDAFYALMLSVLAILLLHPLSLYDLGFQLSVLSVAALILGLPRLWRLFPEGWRVRLFSSGLGWRLLRASLDVTLGSVLCALACLPVVLPAFHRVSLASIPANLLVVPFFTWVIVPLLLLAQLAFGVAGATVAPLLDAVSWLTARTIDWQDWIVAHSPAMLHTAPMPGWVLGIWAASVGLLVVALPPLGGIRGRPDLPLWREWPWRAGIAGVAALLALIGWLGRATPLPEPPEGVWVAPLSEGTSVLVRRADGNELISPGRVGRAKAKADAAKRRTLLESQQVTSLTNVYLLSAAPEERRAATACLDELPVGTIVGVPPVGTRVLRGLGWRRDALDAEGRTVLVEREWDRAHGARWRMVQLKLGEQTLLVVSQPWRLTATDWAWLIASAGTRRPWIVLVGVPKADLADLALSAAPAALLFALTPDEGKKVSPELWRSWSARFPVLARTDRQGVLALDASGRLTTGARWYRPLAKVSYSAPTP